MKSYFPLLIEYEGNVRVVVRTPEEILSGKSFKVIKTNFK